MGEISKIQNSWTFKIPILKSEGIPTYRSQIQFKWSIVFRQTDY